MNLFLFEKRLFDWWTGTLRSQGASRYFYKATGEPFPTPVLTITI